jgi:hypothetical protein
MSIFICWSGEKRGLPLAKALKEWLGEIFGKKVEIQYSGEIEKGSIWFEELVGTLDRAKAGLICITPEAVQSNWIHFEAGALFKAVVTGEQFGVRSSRSKIFTFLYGVEPGELKLPLSAFQYTRSDDKEDTRMLVEEIMETLGSDIHKQEGWFKTFDDHWKSLRSRLDVLEPLTIMEIAEDFESWFQRKTFNEPFDECTRQNWSDRYVGALETKGKLEKHRQIVERNTKPYLADLYIELISQLDGYAMDMQSLLLEETRFPPNPEGKLQIEPWILKPCERRRKRIKHLFIQLIQPNGEPVLEEDARWYARLTTLSERKALLIHPFERRIEAGDKTILDKKNIRRYADSPWDFDRIVYYLIQERRAGPKDLENLVEATRQELEKLETMDEPSSLVPLNYALRSLNKAWSRYPGQVKVADQIRELLEDIESYAQQPGVNMGRTKRMVNALKARIGDAEVPSFAGGNRS